MKVILSTGKNQSKEFIVNKDRIVIGRSKKCHICIPSDHISREHLEINTRNGEIFIKDLTLSNWVSYNDEKLLKGIETQYFDFANLNLPGGLSFKIELEVDESSNSGFSYTGEVSATGDKTSTSTNLSPSKDINVGDIYHDPISASPDLQSRLSSAGKTSSDRKGRKELFIMFFAFLFIALSAVFFMSKPQAPHIKADTSLNKKKITPKKPIKKVRTKKKTVVEKKIKTSAELLFDSLYKDEESCKRGYTKRVCAFALKNKTAYEGAILKDNILHVFKNLNSRLRNFFLKKRGFAIDAAKFNEIDSVVAGEVILLPKIMEEMERQKILRVKVHVFKTKDSKVEFIATHTIDPSFYRRYDIEDYDRSYKKIRNSLDLSYFTRELMRFISKEI